MERLLISQLLKWKESYGRKPLVLEGARQVGKAWLLKEFGRKYFKDICYINFEQSDVLGEVFLKRPVTAAYYRTTLYL